MWLGFREGTGGGEEEMLGSWAWSQTVLSVSVFLLQWSDPSSRNHTVVGAGQS